jgi:hypothetical protein
VRPRQLRVPIRKAVEEEEAGRRESVILRAGLTIGSLSLLRLSGMRLLVFIFIIFIDLKLIKKGTTVPYHYDLIQR